MYQVQKENIKIRLSSLKATIRNIKNIELDDEVNLLNEIESYVDENIALYKLMTKDVLADTYTSRVYFSECEKAISKIGFKKLREDLQGYLYLLKDGDAYRIGGSKNINKRVQIHLSSSPTSELIYTSQLIDNYLIVETICHSLFKNMIRGEWFIHSDTNHVVNTINDIARKYHV